MLFCYLYFLKSFKFFNFLFFLDEVIFCSIMEVIYCLLNRGRIDVILIFLENVKEYMFILRNLDIGKIIV